MVGTMIFMETDLHVDSMQVCLLYFTYSPCTSIRMLS